MSRLFRFQDLEIWKKAIEIGHKLFDIADDLERRKLYRFAEQIRAHVRLHNPMSMLR